VQTGWTPPGLPNTDGEMTPAQSRSTFSILNTKSTIIMHGESRNDFRRHWLTTCLDDNRAIWQFPRQVASWALMRLSAILRTPRMND